MKNCIMDWNLRVYNKVLPHLIYILFSSYFENMFSFGLDEILGIQLLFLLRFPNSLFYEMPSKNTQSNSLMKPLFSTKFQTVLLESFSRDLNKTNSWERF